MPNDLKLWCEDCQKGNEGACEKHGPLTPVSDTEAGTKARRSLPHILTHREGRNFKGIFAKEKLVKRLQFGPLQGVCIKDPAKQLELEDKIRKKHGLVYKLVHGDGDLFLLDTGFEETSNWMIFVRPAERKSEQNLVAFQYKGKIFFATIKEIPANAELKVWFSRDYAESMGMRVLSDEGSPWHFRTRQKFTCPTCSVVLSNSNNLANHRCPKRSQTKQPEGFPTQRKKFKKDPFPEGDIESHKVLTDTPTTSREQKIKVKGRPKGKGKVKPVESTLPSLIPLTTSGAATPTTDTTPLSSSTKASTSGEKTVHSCNICDKTFPNRGKLSQHVFLHSGERPFVCQFCSKAFSSRFKLGRHTLIHSIERQHACPVCKRCFHRKDHLKNHLQIHAPTKQFRCQRENCHKEYNSFIAFRKHCAVHAAEDGDLQCKICLEMFPSKPELIQHLKVHVGARSLKSPTEKKFPCDHCDKRFFTRKDVKRHLVVHTGKRDFVCSLCPQKFGRKDHLLRHIKKSHVFPEPPRLEAGDLLAVPGPSSVLHPVDVSIPSSSPSSSRSSVHSLSSMLMAGSSREVPSERTFQAEFFESIKEEPDLTASMENLGGLGAMDSSGEDIDRLLGMYLPEGGNFQMPHPLMTHTVSSQIPISSSMVTDTIMYSTPSLLVHQTYLTGQGIPVVQILQQSQPQQQDTRTSDPVLPTAAQEENDDESATESDPVLPILPGFDQAFP